MSRSTEAIFELWFHKLVGHQVVKHYRHHLHWHYWHHLVASISETAQNYQTELSKRDTSQWIASRILQYDLANCGWYEKEWSIPYWHFQKSQQYSINSRLRKNLSFWGAGDHWGVGCIWAGKPGLTSYICGKHRFGYQVPPSSTCPNIFLFPDRSIPGSRLSGRPMDLPDEGEWGSAIKSICYHNINKRGTPDICHLHFWVNQQKWQISGIKRGL